MGRNTVEHEKPVRRAITMAILPNLREGEARTYAWKMRAGIEIQLHAAEVKLECERRAGSLLSEMELSHGGRPSKKEPVASCDQFG
jgi:hypothetical protein